MREADDEWDQSSAETVSEKSLTRRIEELESSLEDVMDSMRDDAREIHSALDSIRGEITALQQKIAEVESHLDGVIVSWTRSRDDLETAESEAHRTLADRYANFVEQGLYGLARKATQAKQGSVQGEVVADLMRKLCVELFGRADVSEQRVRRVLGVRANDLLAETVRRVVIQGQGIVAESRRMKDWGFWEFDHVPGAPINPARQQTWGRCNTSAPVRFVVAPSYVAGSTIYCRQRVYTELV